MQEAGCQLKSEGESRFIVEGSATEHERWDNDSPIRTAAHEGIKPAMGPAIPISSNAVRLGNGPLMRMEAPSVPIKLGKGIKNGGVAYTR